VTRKNFIKQTSVAGSGILLLNGCDFFVSKQEVLDSKLVEVGIEKPTKGEDVFAYILREKGTFDNTLYKQILGTANEFKEGDKTLNIAALNDNSRMHARELLGNMR